MASRDLHNQIKALSAIDPAAIRTGNAVTTGTTIDTQGFESVEFLVQSGAVTDGTWAVTVEDGDASNMSDAATVDAAYLVGAAPSIAAADDSIVKKIGYRGSKRYVRIKATQTGATTGGFLSAVAVLGHPRNLPAA
jgi:hypothetical protein